MCDFSSFRLFRLFRLFVVCASAIHALTKFKVAKLFFIRLIFIRNICSKSHTHTQICCVQCTRVSYNRQCAQQVKKYGKRDTNIPLQWKKCKHSHNFEKRRRSNGTLMFTSFVLCFGGIAFVLVAIVHKRISLQYIDGHMVS